MHIYLFQSSSSSQRVQNKSSKSMEKNRQRLINPGFLLSLAVEATPPPSSPSWEPRWHSSHFLDNSHNAVGGYSNKGGTAPGYKTLKATDGRDSSGCATIHGFARIETNKGCAGRASRRHFRAGFTYSFRFVTWHAGMRDNYSKMRAHCVLAACWTRDFSRLVRQA